jgi:hypothetical protein
VLKALLVIAAYSDPTGTVAIAVFLEVVVRPFAIADKAGLVTLKEQMLRGDEETAPVQGILEEAILSVLVERVRIQVRPEVAEDQLFELHNFISQKLDEFVRLVIVLNGRDKREHPMTRLLEFAFARSEGVRARSGSPRT